MGTWSKGGGPQIWELSSILNLPGPMGLTTSFSMQVGCSNLHWLRTRCVMYNVGEITRPDFVSIYVQGTGPWQLTTVQQSIRGGLW
jgi:hypothetical protein